VALLEQDVKFFAGCAPEEIVAAIGLKMHFLFERGGGTSPPRTRATVQLTSVPPALSG
jgi:hypothetical protein